MNILLSGSTGFVGNNFKKYLLETGNSYLIFDLTREDLSKDETYLLSQIDSHSIDCVIHLAGLAHDIKRTLSGDAYTMVNFELTKNFYNAFILSKAQKFIFISSVKAVADSADGMLTEANIPIPQSYYGKSKLLAEEYILSLNLSDSKCMYILRPCMIHGPGNKGNLNLLYKIISKGIPYPLAAFENKRSFLSIENLCFVISELLERNDIPSGIYNVADNEALSTNELIKLIATASDRKPKLWKINPGLIRSLAKLGDLLKLPLTTERLNKLTDNYIVDNSKIRLALGKEFPVQARDGIMTTIKSFQGVDK